MTDKDLERRARRRGEDLFTRIEDATYRVLRQTEPDRMKPDETSGTASPLSQASESSPKHAS